MAQPKTKADSPEALDREIDRTRDLPAKLKEQRKKVIRMKPTERFAETPGGWFVVPALAVTVLARKCSGLAQYLAVQFILAGQFGRKDGPAWVSVSCLRLARLTSTLDESGKPKDDGFDAKAFDLALRDLVDRRVVERRKAADKGRGYEYRTWPEEWADAQDPGRLSSTEEDNDPPAESDEPEAAVAPSALGTEVAPGKTAPWTRFEVAVPGLPAPAPIEVNWVNRTSVPLKLTPNLDFKCRISFNITHVSPFVREVEFLSRKPSEGPDYPTVVAELFGALWSKPFDPKSDAVILRDVLKFCGEAPASHFRDAVIARIRRDKPSGSTLALCARNHTPGLLPSIAKDAAASWAQITQMAPRRDPDYKGNPDLERALEVVGPEDSFATRDAWIDAVNAEMSRGYASAAGD